MLYLTPLLIVFVAFGYWLLIHPLPGQKIASQFNEKEKELLHYAPKWNATLPFKNVDEMIRITNLHNNHHFQKLFTEYVEALFIYSKYYKRTLSQSILFRIIEVSVNDKIREKALRQLLKNNKVYSKEKSLEVVG